MKDMEELTGMKPQEITGENVQEAADPAYLTETEQGVAATPENQTAALPDSEPKPQTPEENARYAAIRRRAEVEAKTKAEREMDEKLRKIGMINPSTGTPVHNRDEYELVRKGRAAQERQKFMQENGMDEQQYYHFVDSLPEVRAARIAQQRAETAAVNAGLNAELQQIRAIDPKISSLRDLQNAPAYKSVLALVEKGNSLIDAYKLANFETLTQTAAAAQKQAVLNSLHGKAHMQPVAGRQGGTAAPVPKPVLEQYRMFNPNATEEEIRQHYHQNLQKGS